jgi:antitoxin VapB
MQTTKIFKSGNSMAVRLPAGFQLQGDTVEIIQHNKEIIIREIPKNLSEAYYILREFPTDFFPDGREDELPQERDLL